MKGHEIHDFQAWFQAKSTHVRDGSVEFIGTFARGCRFTSGPCSCAAGIMAVLSGVPNRDWDCEKKLGKISDFRFRQIGGGLVSI